MKVLLLFFRMAQSKSVHASSLIELEQFSKALDTLMDLHGTHFSDLKIFFLVFFF